MKFSKIFAGFSALALSAAMTMSASAETSWDFENGPSDPWVSAFGSFTAVDDEGKESVSDDFIDAKTFTKDQPMTVDVKIEWSETAKNALGYVVIAPAYANGWAKIGDNADDIEVDFPKAEALTDGWKVDGEKVVDDAGKSPDIFLKADGFIQITNPDVDSFSFTIPADIINKMIENANAEDSWDGLIFQIGGGFQVTNVAVSQDGVKLASENQENTADDSSASESQEESKTEESVSTEAETEAAPESESKAVLAKPEESSKAEDSEDSSLNAGLIAGIAIGVVVVAGVIVLVVKKKK